MEELNTVTADNSNSSSTSSSKAIVGVRYSLIPWSVHLSHILPPTAGGIEVVITDAFHSDSEE